MKKRCHFIDEKGNRCYLPAETTYVFLDEECHPGVTWVATDLCAIHKERLYRNPLRIIDEIEEKIQ
jgi:hypothetical protein